MSEKHMLGPWDWAGAEFITIGPPDEFGFVEFIVLEKGTVKREYRPVMECSPVPVDVSYCEDATACSACGKVDNDLSWYDYCPWCGAKVMGE